jgi:hypothetical protein
VSIVDRKIQELIEKARGHRERNVIEPRADALIDELTTELRSVERELDYAYAVIRRGFESGGFDFSVLKIRAEMWNRPPAA